MSPAPDEDKTDLPSPGGKVAAHKGRRMRDGVQLGLAKGLRQCAKSKIFARIPHQSKITDF